MVRRNFPKNVKSLKMEIAKLLILLLLFGFGNGKEVCPKMCICDVFEGYKRADCR